MSLRNLKVGIFFLYCIIWANTTSAQNEAIFSKLTRVDGLSHNNVYSIMQDRFGFMWFGTQDGLNRYDGFNFKQFYHEPSNNNSLSSSNLACFLESNNGTLWFGTYYGGLDMYDPLTDKFTHFLHIEGDVSSISSNNISCIVEDSIGNLWIGTSGGGFNYLDTKDNRFTRYNHKDDVFNTVSSNDVNAIVQDSINNLWIGTNNGLDYYDLKEKEFIHFVLGYESYDQRKQLAIKALLIDKDGLLWIGSSNGLFTFNKETNDLKEYKHEIRDSYSLSDDLINAIYQDSDGNIWVGTEHGLSFYDKEKDRFINYYFDITNPYSISSNRIWSIYEDRAKILWIGTKGGGVNKLDLKRKKFYSLSFMPNNPLSLSHPSVSSIVADSSGNIWLGTDGGGICVFNKKEVTTKCFNQRFNKQNSLSDDQIWSSCYGRGKIWLGMHLGGLNSVEVVDKEYVVKHFMKTGDSLGIANNQVNALMCDKDGFLWIATRDGLSKMIDTSVTQPPYFIRFKKNYSDSNSLSDNYITSLYQDHQGDLWIGTYSMGLNKMNIKTGKTVHFVSDINNSNTIGSNGIHTIFEDHLGVLWVGTAGGGLSKLNQDGKTFTRYYQKDGLASNEVMGILEDRSGFLWISTTKGLSKFDPLNEKFTNFDITDGLMNDGFNSSSVYQDEDGWMYFGTNSGLVYFDPSQIKLNPYIPDIVITKFTLLEDDKWKSRELFISKYSAESNQIILDYDENMFSIEFASLDYTNPGENIFQYKIDQINKEWIDYGNKRSIMVTNLEPGEYTFRIRGSNNDKLLNNEGIVLTIIVRPPFWKTEGFFFILGLVIILIFISIYSFLVKLKTNKILESKNKELEQTNLKLSESEKRLKMLNNTKDKFFSIIAHDLRNPFNPLLALTELLDDDYPDLDESERRDFIKEIRHGAKRLYDLLENLLHWALSQTKQIRYKQVTIELDELIQNNIDLLKINAEKKNILLTKNIHGDSRVLADENMLNSIVRNLLNNAIKFSAENTEIKVNISNSSDSCLVEVKDQGIGIPEENLSTIFTGFSKSTIDNAKGKGSGLGLILCKEFVEKNNGKIWVESKQGEGSSFFFTLKRA